MPWSSLWTDQALRDLSRLDRQVARRVVAKLERASTNPTHYFERLVGSAEDKLRIGEFRLLAVLLYASRTIIVEAVDHQSRVYRRRP